MSALELTKTVDAGKLRTHCALIIFKSRKTVHGLCEERGGAVWKGSKGDGGEDYRLSGTIRKRGVPWDRCLLGCCSNPRAPPPFTLYL